MFDDDEEDHFLSLPFVKSDKSESPRLSVFLHDDAFLDASVVAEIVLQIVRIDVRTF